MNDASFDQGMAVDDLHVSFSGVASSQFADHLDHVKSIESFRPDHRSRQLKRNMLDRSGLESEFANLLATHRLERGQCQLLIPIHRYQCSSLSDALLPGIVPVKPGEHPLPTQRLCPLLTNPFSDDSNQLRVANVLTL